MRTRKLMVVLASVALGLGLAGCAGSADASAPVPKVPTVSDMAREKQVLNAERDKKIARDFAARVKAEAEAKAKAEAEAKAKAAAAVQAQAQAGSGAARSGTSARSYQPKTRSNYRQGVRAKSRSSYRYKARPGRSARRGGGGGGDLSYDDIRRRSAELDRAERARNVPEKDTSGVIVCVGGNC